MMRIVIIEMDSGNRVPFPRLTSWQGTFFFFNSFLFVDGSEKSPARSLHICSTFKAEPRPRFLVDVTKP